MNDSNDYYPRLVMQHTKAHARHLHTIVITSDFVYRGQTYRIIVDWNRQAGAAGWDIYKLSENQRIYWQGDNGIQFGVRTRQDVVSLARMALLGALVMGYTSGSREEGEQRRRRTGPDSWRAAP
jgi:hypothetical protein